MAGIITRDKEKLMPNLTQFYQQFTNDLSRANRFEVFIPPPGIINQYYNNIPYLTYRCEAAQLPGRHLTTVNQKTFGPYEKFPVHTTYNDIDLTFIVDGNMTARNIFDAWIDYINPASSNNFRYRQEYETTITVNQYSVDDKMIYQSNLYEAYPVSINQLDLDWSSEGYHKLTVTFAYTYWRNAKAKDASYINVQPGNLSSVQEWY